MIVIGIDPGIGGGIASYNGEILDVSPMPFIDEFAVKKEMDWQGVIDLAQTKWMKHNEPNMNTHVFIEQTWAHPKQGVTSVFTFGYHSGALYGIFLALGFFVHYVSPQKWKAAMGLTGKEKLESVKLAETLFPEHQNVFRGPKGGPRDGPAESSLIAKYGYDFLSEGK
jgi:crossover junction endodeoxyribonuclease RuvC